MRGFLLPAAASVMAGLLLGAAAIVCITLLAQGVTEPTLVPANKESSVSSRVDYGDRCFHGHCLSCSTKQGCANRAPWP
jgi:Protein of unknown function (DUF2613)